MKSEFHGAPHQETNKDAVLTALKALQARIRQLEHDRYATHEVPIENSSLENDKCQLTDVDVPIDFHPVSGRESSPLLINEQNKEFELQLYSVANRCKQLEKQLHDMRQTMNNSQENSKNVLNEKYHVDVQGTYRKYQSSDDNGCGKHFHKEKKHIGQPLPQNKEFYHSLYDKSDIDEICNMKDKKPSMKKSKSSEKLRNIGKLNKKNIFEKPMKLKKTKKEMLKLKSLSTSSSSSSLNSESSNTKSSSSTNELDILLIQLKEEFELLSKDHEKISTSLLQNHDNPQRRKQLENQVDAILEKMEKKAKQIEKLASYKTKQRKNDKSKTTRENVTIKSPGKIKVTTTVRTCEKRNCKNKKSKERFHVLKKIQDKLGQNDVRWI